MTEGVTSDEEDTFGDDVQPGEDSDYEVGSNTDGSEGGESNDHEAGSNADDNEDGESNNLDEEVGCQSAQWLSLHHVCDMLTTLFARGWSLSSSLSRWLRCCWRSI
jgi:hypothetical protein